MREIRKMEDIYLEDFDIYVHKYLTYAEIQSIVNAIIKLDTWAERQEVSDLLVLTYATSMSKEEISSFSHDDLIASGLIDQVTGCIENIYQINDAIRFTTSLENIASQFLKNIPQLTEELKKVADKYADSKK